MATTASKSKSKFASRALKRLSVTAASSGQHPLLKKAKNPNLPKEGKPGSKIVYPDGVDASIAKDKGFKAALRAYEAAKGNGVIIRMTQDIIIQQPDSVDGYAFIRSDRLDDWYSADMALTDESRKSVSNDDWEYADDADGSTAKFIVGDPSLIEGTDITK